MIGIKINDVFLDISPDTTIPIQLNNPMFSKSTGEDAILGSFSMPFNIGVTPKNRAALDYPDLLDNELALNTYDNVELYFCLDLLYRGQLTVTKANDKQYRLNFIFNPFGKLKDVSLTDIFKNDYRKVGINISQADMVAHANDTALNPQNYDYTFFPIWNFRFFEDNQFPPGGSDYQNEYDFQNSTFVESINQQSAMPFIKVCYVLEKIYEYAGIPHQDKWKDPELENLVIYNNHSIYKNESQWSDTIRISDHLPNCSAGEFILEIARYFNLAVFPDFFSQSVCTLPVRDFAISEPKFDWTKKGLANQQICSDNQIDTKFCFEKCDDDVDNGFYSRNEIDIDNIGYYENTGSIPVTTPIIVYDLFSNQYISAGPIIVNGVPQPPQIVKLGRGKPCFDTGKQGKTRTVKAQPIYQTVLTQALGTEYHIPYALFNGTITYNEPNDLGITTNVRAQDHDIPKLKLMFYRGMKELPGLPGQFYPHGSNGNVTFNNEVTGQYSLNWIGEDGIYNQWFKNSYGKFNGKVIEQKYCLTINDIKEFSFQCKIKSDNRNYFVKQLNFILSNQGIKPVRTQLVSAT